MCINSAGRLSFILKFLDVISRPAVSVLLWNDWCSSLQSCKKEKKKKEGFKVRAQPLRKNDVSPKPLLLFSFRYFSTPCWLLPCVHQSGSHKNSILSSHFKRIDPLFSSDRKISLSLYSVVVSPVAGRILPVLLLHVLLRQRRETAINADLSIRESSLSLSIDL